MQVSLDNATKQIAQIANDLITILPNLLIGALIFALFLAGSKLASKVVRTLASRAGQNHGVGLLLGRFAQYIVVGFGLLVALSTVFPSFRAKDLIQVLGIGGVAVGFAFKDIFQNFLAGVIILVTRPFRIGDQIICKDFEGTVEDIQTRATMITTYDNRRIVIPNTILFTEEVTVITAYEKRRLEYEIGIGYGDDVETAKKVILNELAKIEGVEEEPAPDVLTMNFGDSAVILRIRCWAAPVRTNVLVVRDAIFSALSRALPNAGIDIPFPTTTLLMHNQTQPEDKHPDRRREGWPMPLSASGGSLDANSSPVGGPR